MPAVASAFLGAAKVAADASGVPCSALAVSAIEIFIKQYEEVEGHEEQCRALREKCQEILDALESSGQGIDGPENEALRASVDELAFSLDATLRKMYKWAHCNWFKRWLKRGEIQDELSSCSSRIDAALAKFNAKTTVDISAGVAKLNQHVPNQVAMLEDMASDVKDIVRDAKVSNKSIMMIQEQLAVLVENGHRTVTISHVQTSSQEHFSAEPTIVRTVQESEEYTSTARQAAQLLDLGVLPEIRKLDGQINVLGNCAESSGAFSDIWKGQWVAGKKVAVKAMRGPYVNNESARKRFDRQLEIWRRLSHPHIVQFHGISVDAAPNSRLSLISAWQKHGNILQYVQQYPDADKLHLMCGAAEGLAYLHVQMVIHGDVKCSNILVSYDVEAQICDFGVSKIVEDIVGTGQVTTMTTSGKYSNVRWMPPELLEPRPDSQSASFASDVYSFARSILECITGARPYSHLKKDSYVVLEICSNKKDPPRPSGPNVDKWMTDELWKLLTDCWAWDPEGRPTMAAVAHRLMEIHAGIQA